MRYFLSLSLLLVSCVHEDGDVPGNRTATIDDTLIHEPRPIIVSMADFDRLAAAGTYPLNRLDPDTLAAFRAGLEFVDLGEPGMKGLRRYDYRTIDGHLTMAEYAALIDLFKTPPGPGSPCPPRGRTLDLPSSSPLRPIKTKEEFDELIVRGHPVLDKLTPVALQRFRDSMTWTERGLGGAHNLEVISELTEDEVRQLLALFTEGAPLSRAGLGSNAIAAAPPDDPYLQDHYCAGHATCSKKLDSWCNLDEC